MDFGEASRPELGDTDQMAPVDYPEINYDQVAKNIAHIENAATQIGHLQEYRVQTKSGVAARVWVVDSTNADIEPQNLQQYVDELDRARKIKNFDSLCYQIGASAVVKGAADGVMHSRNNDASFVGYLEHAVNIDHDNKGRAFSIDYTSRESIGQHMSNFDLLIIGADSDQQLAQRLSSVYGGDWKSMTSSEIQEAYSVVDLRP